MAVGYFKLKMHQNPFSPTGEFIRRFPDPIVDWEGISLPISLPLDAWVAPGFCS